MVRQYTVLAIGVIAVSFAAIFIRLADAPPLVIATYRLCLASLVLLPIGLTHSRKELGHLPRRSVLLAIISGSFLALHFALWITSLDYTTVATSVVLVTASPIFIAFASRLFFSQRLRRGSITGIIVSLLGAILIGYGNWKTGAGSLLGAILAFVAALSVAGYMLIGQRLRQDMGTLSYASLAYATAAVLLLLSALFLRNPLSGFPATTYVMLVLLAAVPQLLGHTSLNWSLRFVPATFVAIAVLGEPVGATLWAYLMLDETPSPTEIVGGILILAGIFLAMRSGQDQVADSLPTRD